MVEILVSVEFTTLDDEVPGGPLIDSRTHTMDIRTATSGNVMVGSSRHGYTDKWKGRKRD
jgi:hypothetical protein